MRVNAKEMSQAMREEDCSQMSFDDLFQISFQQTPFQKAFQDGLHNKNSEKKCHQNVISSPYPNSLSLSSYSFCQSMHIGPRNTRLETFEDGLLSGQNGFVHV